MDLTGTWAAGSQGLYFLRQLGNELWWAGLSVESPLGSQDFQWGLTWANVFTGQINDTTVNGDWADVPRGRIRQSGTLDLEVADADLIRRRAETGGFGATEWRRTDLPARPLIRTRFDQVQRNDGGSMHDHLKMYKDNVVVFGTVVDGLGASCPPDGVSRRYANFMCNEDRDFDDGTFDGDLVFHIVIDRADLDAQPGFWTNEWFNDPAHIRRKLDHDNTDQDSDEENPALELRNLIHPEVIMYGRPAGKRPNEDPSCTGAVPPLLPGWMETGANSVLWNGYPIDGRVNIYPTGPAPVRVFDQAPPPGTRVRITGFLALDCHGRLGDCNEDNVNRNNVELHPVYAVDVLRDPRIVPTDLTGVWACSDVGTYYIRQLGSTVRWFGMSRDRGQNFSNVFHGTLDGVQLSGTWADVPLGAIRNNGTLTLAAPAGASSVELTRSAQSGGFGGHTWTKIADGPGPIIPPG
ncbi:hypothetical protein [Streptomyces sp. STR69]|uniref:hypothetical protein n=1 Tax=Streptomyces sp. STR69 TaxID=1796942 RepID=UPI0021CAAFFD|nr:hypothetical protein [Streptomyces sp. STR69]